VANKFICLLVGLVYVRVLCDITAGNRATADMSGWHSLPSVHKSRSESGRQVTVVADVEPCRDEYYGSVGRKSATAFNRHAFSSRSPHSVIF